MTITKKRRVKVKVKGNIKAIEWCGSYVKLIDQTKLPYEYTTVKIDSYDKMGMAIKDMLVRGAPAIGVSAAFGVVLGAMSLADEQSWDDFYFKLLKIGNYLKSTRPTAVNLKWAVDIQMKLLESYKDKTIKQAVEALEENAIKILNDDISINKNIGDNGVTVMPKSAKILTHCNAGSLATAGYGTALGVVRSAFTNDPTIQVYANETRPRQQGARLTVWECVQENIPVTLVTDGMCGYLMSKSMIDVVVVGADRIAANGDAANKIGTFTVAIAAKAFDIPFYVAAPLSTIDTSIESGEEIPIEERCKEEITHINGKLVCPDCVNVFNPGFDVTPADYITGIITEVGILKPDYKKSIKDVF